MPDTERTLGFPYHAKVMGYRTSRPLWTFTIIGVLCIAVMYLSIIFHGDARDVIIVSLIISSLLVLVHVQQMGYRVAWDENGLYVRRWGIFNTLGLKHQITSMPWSKVLAVLTSARVIFGRNYDYDANEFLEFRFSRKTADRVRVYPYMIDMKDFEEFARFVADKLKVAVELS